MAILIQPPAADPRAAAESLFAEGCARQAAGYAAAAARLFREALFLHPTLAEAWANLALLAEAGSDWREAEACHRRAVTYAPELHQQWLNLGAFLLDRGRPEEGRQACEQAAALAPDAPEVWLNLGVAHLCGGSPDAAERCLRLALALRPDYAAARFNLAYLLLGQGRWQEGWACYESRPWLRGLAAHFAQPRWQGEPLAGRHVLVVAEGGLGDAIHFVRFASRLKAAGAGRVSLLCHPPLLRLFQGLPNVDAVASLGEAQGRTEGQLWVPLMSLPGLLDCRPDQAPSPFPYLSADPVAGDRWQARLPQAGRRVGLAWQGNPAFENDSQRSLADLAVLAPLGGIPGLTWVGVQKGPGADRPAPPALALTNVGPWLEDMAETAALLCQLDLLITVDTAVAHLAGALGLPCWLLLPHYRVDWRWGGGSGDGNGGGQETSFWYPSLRLFRQATPGDWPEVVARLAPALAAWAAGKAPHHEGEGGGTAVIGPAA